MSGTVTGELAGRVGTWNRYPEVLMSNQRYLSRVALPGLWAVDSG